MKRTFMLALILLTGTMFGQDMINARALGMGGAYTSVTDDATALRWNPGGLGLLNQRNLSGGFSRLYMGIDGDAIGRGYMGYAQKVPGTWGGGGNIGLGWTNLFSNVYSENVLHLGYGYDLGRHIKGLHQLGIGVTGNLVMTGYNEANFVNNPDESVPIADSPLFADGMNTMGMSVDFGMLAKPRPNMAISLVLNDINQPSTSLEADVEGGNIPLSGVLGFSYMYEDWLMPSVDLRFVNWDINDKNKFEYNVGVEGWFSEKTFGLRTGINPNDFSIGGTYNVWSKPSFQINYAFLYPLSDLGRVSTTHRLSVTARMPYAPPKLKKVNLKALSLDVTPVDGVCLTGDSRTVTGRFTKTGDMEAKNFIVSFWYENSDGEARVIDRKTISSIGTGDTLTQVWVFTEEKAGDYTLRMHVDDDGTDLPNLNGKIDETNENDNTSKAGITFVAPSTISIDLLARSLVITKASIRKTEEPQVPVVFFDEGSITPAERYDYMLSRVAERLDKNPDSRVVLRGYHSKTSADEDRELAFDRADVVSRRLIMLGADPEQIRVEKEGYDPSAQRAREQYAGEDDRPMVAHENRRVEISVELIGDQQAFTQNLAFAPRQDTYTAPIRNADVWEKYLTKNPQLVLLVEGIVGLSETGDPTLGLRRADAIRDRLLKEMPGMENRIFIFDKNAEEQGGMARVSLLADGILYEPYAMETTPVSMEMSERYNRVLVNFDSDADIESHHIYIEDDEDQIVKTIAKGTGAPEMEYTWDWTDDSGEILAPGKQYYAVGKVVNARGKDAEGRSEPIHVEIKEIVDIVESILIVNFNFDAAIPVSPYFETRLDMTARKFIEDAKREKFRLEATVKGHTDVVGNQNRNEELSRERSLREYTNIRRYMKYLLGFKTDQELNNWVREHGASLKHEGLGFKEPYEIKKRVADSEIEVLVGDNTLPEGRNVNRRVVIEYKLLPKD